MKSTIFDVDVNRKVSMLLEVSDRCAILDVLEILDRCAIPEELEGDFAATTKTTTKTTTITRVVEMQKKSASKCAF